MALTVHTVQICSSRIQLVKKCIPGVFEGSKTRSKTSMADFELEFKIGNRAVSVLSGCGKKFGTAWPASCSGSECSLL